MSTLFTIVNASQDNFDKTQFTLTDTIKTKLMLRGKCGAMGGDDSADAAASAEEQETGGETGGATGAE